MKVLVNIPVEVKVDPIEVIDKLIEEEIGGNFELKHRIKSYKLADWEINDVEYYIDNDVETVISQDSFLLVTQLKNIREILKNRKE